MSIGKAETLEVDPKMVDQGKRRSNETVRCGIHQSDRIPNMAGQSCTSTEAKWESAGLCRLQRFQQGLSQR